MNKKKIAYISSYNKEKYKMYQFRIKKSDSDVLSHLEMQENKNHYLNNLICNDIESRKVLTIKNIKNILKPICEKYNINEIYLFGSYARGEAKADSDIDIYCDRGNIDTLTKQSLFEEELKKALNKDVDVVFTTSRMNSIFKKSLMEDMIKLC